MPANRLAPKGCPNTSSSPSTIMTRQHAGLANPSCTSFPSTLMKNYGMKRTMIALAAQSAASSRWSPRCPLRPPRQECPRYPTKKWSASMTLPLRLTARPAMMTVPAKAAIVSLAVSDKAPIRSPIGNYATSIKDSATTVNTSSPSSTLFAPMHCPMKLTRPQWTNLKQI